MFKNTTGIFILGAALLSLAACGTVETEAKYPTGLDRDQTGGDIYGERESIFGEGGLKIFGDKGMHTRAAVSSNSLPLGVAVEVDAIFELN